MRELYSKEGLNTFPKTETANNNNMPYKWWVIWKKKDKIYKDNRKKSETGKYQDQSKSTVLGYIIRRDAHLLQVSEICNLEITQGLG